MEPLVTVVVWLHSTTNPALFFSLVAGLSVLLCFFAIPRTAGLMVNNAAGLAGKWFSPSSRSLVINASTNNPEAFSMAASLGIGRMGGWANPLGSLLANCYLMYGLAVVYVILKFLFLGKKDQLRRFLSLLAQEKKLVAWHMAMAIGMFVAGTLVLRLVGFGSGSGPGDAALAPAAEGSHPRTGLPIFLGILVLSAGVALFAFFDRRLKRSRPGLFTDIDAAKHGQSLFGFLLGATGLIAACCVMNSMFASVEVIYGESLSGVGVFAVLHYFVGALITSLPELKVATENYVRLTAPDLNTALGAASYSNVVNLAIALIGLLIFAGLHLFGRTLSW